jgi:hypothetical protein
LTSGLPPASSILTTGSPTPAPPVSVIEDLKQAVLKNPKNADHVVQLSRAFTVGNSEGASCLLWLTMVDNYQGDKEGLADILLATLRANSGPSSVDSALLRLHEIFSNRFPSSSIPKDTYHLLRQARSLLDAERFLIDHLQGFCTRSSLIDMTENEMDPSYPICLHIWEPVFLRIPINSDILILAERLRKSHSKWCTLPEYVRLWERLVRKELDSLERQLFVEFQEALTQMGMRTGVTRVVERWGKVPRVVWFLEECVRALGKMLALSIRTLDLVEWYGLIVDHAPHIRESFIRGLAEGFQERGYDKGLIKFALHMDSGGMRDVLNFLLSL